MLAIIGAMENVVAGLKDAMSDIEITNIAGMDFYRGKLEGKEVVVVQSGIGKVNAAICTQILIDNYDVTAVINTGVATSLKSEIEIGDIVISTDAVEHDMNARTLGYDRGIIPGMETSFFVADDYLIQLAKECVKESVDANVYEGRVVSGDLFVSEQKIKDKLNAEFDGYCAEMEGGAIAHCACVNKVPFVVIRSVSDKSDSSEEVDYTSFEKMVVKNTIKLLLAIVGKYVPGGKSVDLASGERKLKNKDITYKVSYKTKR